MLTASITSSITSLIGDHGIYAIFVLMLVDAVFPAFSELVMVYAGALAAGAFVGQDVVVFGHEVPSGWQSFLCVVAAGTIGYTIGSLMGWAIGDYGGRPLVERHGRWFHLSARAFRSGGTLVRPLGRLGRFPRAHHARRPLLHLDPGGRLPASRLARTRCSHS